jgi:membrane protease YdiL (CAAX protease family)
VKISDPVVAREPWLRPELIASWKEIALVLAVTIGPFAIRSAWAAGHGSSSTYINMLLTDSRLLTGVAVESAILALLFAFLYWRGWTPSDFQVRPGWWGNAQAVCLLMAVTLANIVTVIGLLVLIFSLQTRFAQFLPFLVANSPHLKTPSVDVSWGVLIVTMVLNAFYEELTCIGYAFNQFAAKRGPLFALLLTVLLRMSCHSYQGPVHMLGIGTVFLFFGLLYWHLRNLWPLILAHALLDLSSTGIVKLIFG